MSGELYNLALLGIVGAVGITALAIIAVFRTNYASKGNTKEQPLVTKEVADSEVMLKLNEIQREQRKGGALANAAFGLAVSSTMLALIPRQTELYMRIIGAVIGLIGLSWFLWHIILWSRLLSSKKEITRGRLDG
jgi:hypothetical protein